MLGRLSGKYLHSYFMTNCTRFVHLKFIFSQDNLGNNCNELNNDDIPFFNKFELKTEYCFN